jgi:hypothetical protein
MLAAASAIKKALLRQLRQSKDNLIDLMPLHEAAGRPRGKSPIMWARRIGIEPGMSVEGDGPNKKVWCDRAIAWDYGHYLDRTIPAAHLGKAELEARGWTEGLLRQFLPEPDATATNPSARSGARMSLYLVDRVAKIERSRRFQAAISDADRRKEAASKATKTKREATLRGLENLEITVQVLGREEVIRLAIDHYRAQ